MRIAIIGAGVSGLVFPYLVCRDHDIVVKLIELFKDKIRTSCPVTSVSRKNGRVEVRDGTGGVDTFDRYIFAAHSDQALAMLSDPTEAERKILGGHPLPEKPQEKQNVLLRRLLGLRLSRRWRQERPRRVRGIRKEPVT